MTDYPDLYKRLAQEILKHEGKIAGDAQAFVTQLAAQLQASGQQVTPEIQAELTSYLTAMQAAINTGIVNAATIAAATMPVNLQSATVAKLAEQAYSEQWPDGLKLSDRLWNWQGNVKAGLTKTLQSGIKQGAGVNKIVYDMQRTIERANAGQRFKIIENHQDDWVKELHKSATELIHDPSAKAAWEATVADVEERIMGLKENGSKAAAERVFSQIRLAVTKGNELLADKAVKWWLYDKQLYHLKRIARTEMATAMHRAVIASVEGDDSIIGFQWRLSGSHPVYDICDVYANVEMGLGKGVFTKETVPRHKAHPHCMCLLIPRVTQISTKGRFSHEQLLQKLPKPAPKSSKAIPPATKQSADIAAKQAKDYVLTNGRANEQRKTEFMQAYDENGKVVLTKKGGKSEVIFTESEVEAMANAPGVVLAHNHPGGSSLSGDDFTMAHRIKGTIVAHGHNGVDYIGRVLDIDIFHKHYAAINKQVRRHFQPMVDRAGNDTQRGVIAEVSLFHAHVVNTTLANIGAIEYSTKNMVSIPAHITKVLDEVLAIFEGKKK